MGQAKTIGSKLNLILLAASALLIILAVFAYIAVRNERESRSVGSVERFINQTPKFVFKQIKFCKYVAYGKPDGTNQRLDKLDIFHISGTAELYIEMKNLSLDSANTDYSTKKLSLVFKSPTKVPIGMEIDIPDSSIVNVETITPRRVSAEEAKMAAENVSDVTENIGMFLGGYLGFKGGSAVGDAAGDAAGKFIKHPIIKLLGGTIGSVIGGGIGAGIGAKVGGDYGKKYGYILTENLLTDFHIADGHSTADKEMILQNAKQLIAIELAGGNMLEDTNFSDGMQKYYEEECRKSIIMAMKNFGWEEVNVEFKYAE